MNRTERAKPSAKTRWRSTAKQSSGEAPMRDAMARRSLARALTGIEEQRRGRANTGAARAKHGSTLRRHRTDSQSDAAAKPRNDKHREAAASHRPASKRDAMELHIVEGQRLSHERISTAMESHGFAVAGHRMQSKGTAGMRCDWLRHRTDATSRDKARL